MFGFGGGIAFTKEDIPDQSGRTILVTGGNSGLGAATIKELARHNPAELWLAARTLSTAEEVVKEIQQEIPSVNIRILELDLGSFASIAKAAAEFNANAKRLDVLMLNAGVAMQPAGLSQEGYEIHVGTNHMGHVLLTKLLMPKLLETMEMAGSDVRVVVTTSGAHGHPKNIPFDELKTTLHPSHSCLGTYGLSKLCNTIFTKSLATKYPSIRIVCAHPGVVNTTPPKGMNVDFPWLGPVALFLVNTFGATPEVGARNQLWCAVGSGVVSGTYYEPVGKVGTEPALAKDEKSRKELWEWTEKELEGAGYGGWP